MSEELKQKAFSFDRTTLLKILKGAAIAGAGAFLAIIAGSVDELGKAFSEQPALASLISALFAIVVNGAREWVKGTE